MDWRKQPRVPARRRDRGLQARWLVRRKNLLLFKIICFCSTSDESVYLWRDSLRDTGDLAYIENRRIVHMGRKDNQFKVHGKRLMLEAIESELLQLLPQVVQCNTYAPPPSCCRK